MKRLIFRARVEDTEPFGARYDADVTLLVHDDHRVTLESIMPTDEARDKMTERWMNS